MKSAGKARNDGLYRHIRTSKEIIRNLLNDYYETIGEVPEPVIDPKKTALLIVDMQNQFVLRDSPEAEAFKAAGEWERWIPFHDRLE